MVQNFTNFLHVVIISTCLLVLNGCGYKGDPIYIDKEKTSPVVEK